MELSTIKEKIISYRKALGLSQQELADRCNLTQSTISTLETGNFYPSMYSFLMVCEGLNITPSQFFLSEEDSGDGLSSDARELLEIWNRLDEKNKELGASIFQCLMESQTKKKNEQQRKKDQDT